MFLALNWFGDSLDGTLARVRGHQRPRYGFYVDHILDTLGVLFVLGRARGLWSHGAARRGGRFWWRITSSASRCTWRPTASGTFRMSFWGWGPTELRILLAAGSLTLLVKPTVTIAGASMRLFDVGGVVAIAGLLLTAAVSIASNTRALYVAEPLPDR